MKSLLVSTEFLRVLCTGDFRLLFIGLRMRAILAACSLVDSREDETIITPLSSEGVYPWQ